MIPSNMAVPTGERAAPTPLRALLLDLDGTLCNTHPLILASLDHTMRTHLDRPAHKEIWQSCIGLPLEAILEATYRHYEAPFTDDQIVEAKETYRTYMRAHADTVRAFPTVIGTLQALRAQGVRLAVVTTKHRAMALRHLNTSGLEPFLDLLVAGDECRKCKPDPEPFLRALHALDISADTAAAVGDSPHDITGGRAAGLYTVAACWGTDCRDALLDRSPDRIATEPGDLLTLLS